MKSRIQILMAFMIAAVLLPLSMVAADRSVSLSANNRSKPVAGAEFTVTLSLNNFDNDYDPSDAIKSIRTKNCIFKSVQPGSKSTYTQIIGGKSKVTSTVSYLLTFKAGKKGICEVGPVDIDGITSNSLSLMIDSSKAVEPTKKPAKKQQSTFYLVPYLSTTKPMVGEQIEYELRLLCSESDPGQLDIQVLKDPEFEDFDAQPLRLYGSPSGRMKYKDKVYNYTVVGKWLLTPLKEKSLVVRGGEYSLRVIPRTVGYGFWGPEYVPDYNSSYDVILKVSSLRVKAKGYKAPDKKPKAKQQTPDTKNNRPEGPVYHI